MAIVSRIVPCVLSVDYEELSFPDASPTEHVGKEYFQATRILQCDWADRLTLYKELLGYTEQSGDTVIYHQPHAYPHNKRLFADEITTRPEGPEENPADSSVMEWKKALLTVQYRVPPFGVVPDDTEPPETLVSESLEPSAQFLTLNGRKVYWDNAQAQPLGEDYDFSFPVRQMDWVYTRHQMPWIPAAVTTLVGTCNEAEMTSATLGLTFPPETLLFGTPQLSRDITNEGYQAWRATFRFTYKPSGWNTVYNKATGQFAKIYDENGNQLKPITPADFYQIIG